MRLALTIGITASALTLTACNSGLDAAKEEMTSSCVASAGGQLTEEECGCMTDNAFDKLNGDEQDFMATVASTDQNISEEDLADELGMEVSEMRAMSQSVARKLMSDSIANAQSCVAAG